MKKQTENASLLKALTNRTALYPQAVEALRALAAEGGIDAVDDAYSDATADQRQAAFMETFQVTRHPDHHVCFPRLLGASRCPENGHTPCDSPMGVPGRDHLSEWRRQGEGTVAIVHQHLQQEKTHSRPEDPHPADMSRLAPAATPEEAAGRHWRSGA